MGRVATVVERLTIGLALVAAMLAVATPAHAHQGIDGARRAYEDAEFEAALAQLRVVEASDDLTREELVELLELRAELHLATGDADAMERDVLQRTTVDPTGALPSSAPPEMREAATRARAQIAGPIEVRAEAVAVATGVTIEAAAHGDAGGLVREVRVMARVDGGSWRDGRPPMTLEGAGRVEFYAEAIGPGGVVLSSAGSRDAPRTWSESGAGAPGAGGDDALWIGLGIGAGVLVVGAVIAIVVVATQPSGPSDRTQPSLPTIVSF